ncbi:MAG: type IV pilus twitching motility protein PilT [Dehalococcoidia bacterium]|nr:type IV pilus twitching motility protein PilT [Dehalococcoidia bacterium]
MQIEDLLRLTVERGASDLHLRVPSPPILRIDGSLKPVEDLPGVTPQYSKEALEHITTETQRDRFYKDLELDLAYSMRGLGRFRVSAFFQRGTISLAIRQVSLKIPTIDELGLPAVCKTLVLKPRGLVLVTGPTGTGKSTTLASMINHLYKNDARNVITIEDPIEFMHQNEKCIIAQRDLGDDTKSFATALRHALRQDPDVILVGEMRDLETISTAITAAETGHLVLSTLHTSSAPQTIDRIIDVFPAHQQEQVRFQVGMVLQGVLSQTLIPRAAGKGRVAAFEIMVSTDAVRNLIREGRTDQLPTYLQTGRQHGMQTMDQDLQKLVKAGAITLEEALMRCTKPEEFRNLRG